MTTQAQPSPTSAGQQLAPPDESGHGLSIAILALASTLAVTAAIVLIALFPAVWVTACAFAVLVAVTGAIVALVLRAVSRGTRP